MNPTREENYPTVNMESIACGTPVLTFNTGGSPEIPDDKTGYVVDVEDIDEMEKQIKRICTTKLFSTDDCLKRPKAFDAIKKYQEYIDLYRQSLIKDKRCNV
ncbi:MAG: glycosyltransferase [Oscillospiraceae bacterium]|nr:glycosyltransferase [Oscillospiraceae bacterium]